MLLHFMKRRLETSKGEQKGEQIWFTRVYSVVKHLDITGVSAHKI